MYKYFITSIFITTLTGNMLAAQYSASSKTTIKSIDLSHASKPTPSLSVSRCPRGMGSAFTPGFIHQIATTPVIGTVAPSVTLGHGREMNYVGGKDVPYERRRYRGDAR